MRIPIAKITYPANNADQQAIAEGYLNNPIRLFGRVETPYAILFTDAVGTSIVGGGLSFILGYTYGNGEYGAQLLIKYSGKLKLRQEQSASWTGWLELSIA